MAKIIAPNKQYTGISASVSFINGEGETERPELIEWFKNHGYEVEEVQEVEEEVKEAKKETPKKSSKK